MLYNLLKVFKTDKEHKIYRKKIENILGFKPVNYAYYEMAFLHSSASSSQKKNINGHNERLEFLGDSVLDLIVADIVYQQFPDKKEGELTRTRAIIVNRSQLNQIAKTLGLDKLIIGNFVRNVLPEDVKGNALEALVGAIYLDKGFQFCQNYIQKNILNKHLNFQELLTENRDYKSELFMWAQRNKKSIRFETVGDKGSATKKRYIINILINGKVSGTGEGVSKKKAEHMASKNACHKLNINRQI